MPHLSRMLATSVEGSSAATGKETMNAGESLTAQMVLVEDAQNAASRATLGVGPIPTRAVRFRELNALRRRLAQFWNAGHCSVWGAVMTSLLREADGWCSENSLSPRKSNVIVPGAVCSMFGEKP